MIQFFLIALLAMGLVTAAAITAAVTSVKKAGKAEKEMEALHMAFRQVKEKAERLQKALGENAWIEEEANVDRRALEQTPDSGLADRANSLFRMRDGKAGKPGSGANADGAPAAPAGPAGDGAGTV